VSKQILSRRQSSNCCSLNTYIFRLLRDQLLAGDFAANVKLLQVKNMFYCTYVLPLEYNAYNACRK